MKIIRYAAGNGAEYGILDGEQVQSLTGDPYARLQKSGQSRKLSDVKLLSPCTPSKIVAAGLNYYSHAEELKMPIPPEPLLFFKPSTAVIGPGENIFYPPFSKRLDYEAELGVVIKTRTRQVSREEAMSCVLGYICFNDVTARDLQAKDDQWARAKGCDTFAPIGPHIETELDPGNVWVESYLNGERKQRVNTSDLIFPIPELVSYISHVLTLLPGDIIATGTPSGIGPMNRGDTIEIKIDAIGTLTNYVT
ncbi:fumarylacetoacetate hydrolase family protein [Chloroflexota bacterium]